MTSRSSRIDLIQRSKPVGSLPGYTLGMWECLVDWFASELRVELPSPFAWPQYERLKPLACARHELRVLKTRIGKRLQNSSRSDCDIFSCYGLSVASGGLRWSEGLDFLSRQADHLPTDEEVLVVCISTNELESGN